MTVEYLNVTINRNPEKRELEIVTDRSSQTHQNQRVDGYGHRFAQPRRCGLGHWMVLEPH
jgi:hypothetical protein